MLSTENRPHASYQKNHSRFDALRFDPFRMKPTVPGPEQSLGVWICANPFRSTYRLRGGRWGGVFEVEFRECVALSVSMICLRFFFFFGLAHRKIDRVAQTDVLGGMFRSGDADVDVELFLVLAAQKFLRICCVPSVG